MSQKQANTSEAGWALITEGVTAARVDAHRLKKLISMAQKLVERSKRKDHLYQVAGDLIMGIPSALERLERALDRTSYALAKIGEDHLKDRLSISDRSMVEDGIRNSRPFPGGHMQHTSAERVARQWAEKRAGKSYEDRLEEGVSQDTATTHKLFLKHYALPLKKKLNELFRWGAMDEIFDRREQKLLEDVRYLLEKKSVPVALVKVEPEQSPLLLRRK